MVNGNLLIVNGMLNLVKGLMDLWLGSEDKSTKSGGFFRDQTCFSAW